MLDLMRLRLLRELAYRSTMIAVADAFGLTSSAVSQQLATLEREARVTLFERVGRRVRLTAEGQRLAAHAQTVIDAVEAAERDLRAARGSARGTLEVASFGTYAKEHLLPAIRHLRARNDALRIVVRELEPADAIDAVRAGTCHVAIVFSYSLVPRPEMPGLLARPLLEEPVLLALPRSWRRTRDALNLKRLAEAEWIVGSRGSDDHRLAERACAVAGFQPRIGHTVDDYDLLLRMVAQDLGVGFVPRLGFRFPSAKSVTVRAPAGPPLSRRIEALTRRSVANEAAVELLLDALRRTHPSHSD